MLRLPHAGDERITGHGSPDSFAKGHGSPTFPRGRGKGAGMEGQRGGDEHAATSTFGAQVTLARGRRYAGAAARGRRPPGGARMDLGIMLEGQEGLDWGRWRRYAQRVEDLGYESLWRSDHFFSLSGHPERDALE